MAVLDILFLSSFLVAYLVCPCTYAVFITHSCSATTTNDSSFRTALVDAFSHLASASSTSRSNRSTSTGGVGVGEIYASFHCWRSIPSQMACEKCVESATKSVLRLCPGHQNATVWNSACTLHYYTSHDDHPNTLSSYNSDEQDNVPWAWWYSLSKIDEVINQSQFDDSLTDFMSGLIEKATNSTRSYTSREVIVTILDTLYGTVECSRSESRSTCKACLRAAVARLSGCCGGSRAAEVIMPSCRLGYDLGPSMSRASLVGPFSSSSFSRVASKSVAKR